MMKYPNMYDANGVFGCTSLNRLIIHSDLYSIYWRRDRNTLQIRNHKKGFSMEIYSDGSRSYGSGPENDELLITMNFDPEYFCRTKASEAYGWIIIYASSQEVNEKVERLLKLKAFI